ncbi:MULTISPECIES: TlpA family protein disulfide reductase [unclassified Paraflavitalea]|uniref:TlpA family protein disulfide reductase n=1 Tax=unclassified Paraflavitalea TaxID=2798305 RepID=UPI003D35075D
MKGMKVLLFVLLTGMTAFAQNKPAVNPNDPPYKRFPSLPPIDLLRVDSSHITKDGLKKQPTIIMYFSPSCDHCNHQMQDMLKQIDKIKKFQWVLATYQPMPELQDFIKKYQLTKYSFIQLGRDVKFTLPVFYGIQNLPHFALYDKKWTLIKTFDGNIAIDKLVKMMNKELN